MNGAESAATSPELATRVPRADATFGLRRLSRLFTSHVSEVVLVAGLAAVAWLRFSQMAVAEAPPGADGGDWLAFAYQLFGQHVRAADAVSPPVVPALIWALLRLFTPLVALKIVAVFTSVVVAVPFYLVMRQEVPAIPSAILALLVPLTGYHSETMAWGGYPQLLGAAFLIATLQTLGEGLVNMSRRMLIASGLCAAMTLGSHQLAAAALVLAVPIFILCLAVQVRPAIRALQLWGRYLVLWTGAAAIFSLPFIPFYLRILTLAQGNPANPQGYSLTSFATAAGYAFRDEPRLWTVLSVGGAVFCLVTIGLRKGSRLAASAAALLFASSLIFASLHEVRAFHIFQIGALEAVALSLAGLFNAASTPSFGGVAKWVARAAVLAALVSVVATLALRGNERSQDTMAYYRVVDAPALEALTWLEQRTPPGSLVVAGQTPRDGPYSWWVEGIAKRPAYSTNLKFLRGYNREEQEQILFARRLLSPSTSADTAARLIRARHISFFFLNKAASQDFTSLTATIPMKVVFENQAIEILAPSVP